MTYRRLETIRAFVAGVGFAALFFAPAIAVVCGVVVAIATIRMMAIQPW